MGKQEVARRVSAAKTHLGFMTELYRTQLESGAHFLHEHPASASSWQEPCTVELLNQPEAESGVGHTRRFGT
eukprot:5949891-Alexandrium_andersonii.AAC.1